jgi:threonine dehydratase
MNFDVRECTRRLAPWIIKTPLVEADCLSHVTGKRVFLKLESMQRTGAFKFRGAMNYMLMVDRTEAARGVITASSGNHGLGMSLGGKLLGLACTVVMPETAPQVKQERARGYGATVVLHGGCYDEAQDHAKALAEREGYAYVPSFNHPAIIEGQGTIMGEILSELPDTHMVVSPVGGGGLISGLLVAREQLGSSAEIVGVEPFGAASMHASLQEGKLVTLKAMETIADGVAVRTPGNLTFDIVSRLKPDITRVSDEEIVKAQRYLLSEFKLIVESAAAVPVAALLNRDGFDHVQNVVIIITGANLDLSYLKGLID